MSKNNWDKVYWEKHLKDHVTEIEKNYYESNVRNVRLFDKPQFELFFMNFEEIRLLIK